MVDAKTLAEWKALADAATEGPWGHSDSLCASKLGSDLVLLTLPDGRPVAEIHNAHGDNNSAFVTAARTAVPKLLEEVERLKAILTIPVRIASRQGGKTTELMGAAVAQARRAERERCAKVASDWAMQHQHSAVLKAEDAPMSAESHFESATAGLQIAARLRTLPDEP